MTAGDERPLVRRGDDLARLERRHGRPEADDAAGSYDNDVDVVSGGKLKEGVVPADETRARRELPKGSLCDGNRCGTGRRHLFGQKIRVPPSGQGDDVEIVRQPTENVQD